VVVFIATNHFLTVAPFLSTAGGPHSWSGRSAPCTSTTEIATVSSNGYINDYKCIKCVVRYQTVQSRTVQLCTLNGPRGR
jgi:hypothetical protein